MENTFLIDLSLKYGLGDEQISKVVDMVYQLGYLDVNAEDFQRAANYICTMDILELPAEELLEEMRRKGFGKKRGKPQDDAGGEVEK